jgi:apolipoprotein D and lipocalin family protein
MSTFASLAIVSTVAAALSIVTGSVSAALWKQRPAVAKRPQPLNGLTPVKALDLASYSGLWYEQRRIDSWFEKDLDFVTAMYEPLDSGFVAVTNTGVRRRSGAAVISRGIARRTVFPGYLLVSFFPLVEGAYVVLYLDPTTSVVGSPDRKYLWLLTRNAAVTDEQVSALNQIAVQNGYTPAQLRAMTVVQQEKKQ